MQAPIIFIHKNDSEYLKYTLGSAKLFNPEKQVIFLGDASNKKYEKLGIEHYCFDDYAESEEIKVFDSVYKFIAGEKVYKTQWVNFVLRRWFHIYEFITKHQISQFWTFDSDNLILTSLAKQESKFTAYDCTEQCNGSCMNGLINNTHVVREYVNKINEIFQRESLLNQFQQTVERNPSFALTEMYCYDVFKEEAGIKSCKLNSIIEGETFDQCLCSGDQMAVYDNPLNGHTVKKLYFGEKGDIYSFHQPSQQHVKLNTINMSWLPIYLFDKIFSQSKKSLKKEHHRALNINNLTLMNIQESVSNKIINKVSNKIHRMVHGDKPRYDLY